MILGHPCAVGFGEHNEDGLAVFVHYGHRTVGLLNTGVAVGVNGDLIAVGINGGLILIALIVRLGRVILGRGIAAAGVAGDLGVERNSGGNIAGGQGLRHTVDHRFMPFIQLVGDVVGDLHGYLDLAAVAQVTLLGRLLQQQDDAVLAGLTHKLHGLDNGVTIAVQRLCQHDFAAIVQQQLKFGVDGDIHRHSGGLLLLLAAAGGEGQYQNRCQKQRQKLFHCKTSSCCFVICHYYTGSHKYLSIYTEIFKIISVNANDSY